VKLDQVVKSLAPDNEEANRDDNCEEDSAEDQTESTASDPAGSAQDKIQNARGSEGDRDIDIGQLVQIGECTHRRRQG